MENYRILLIGTLPPHLGTRNYGGVAKVVWALAKALRLKERNIAIAGVGRYYGGDKVVEGIPVYGVRFNAPAILDTIRAALKNIGRFRGMLIKDKLRLLYALYVLNYLSSRIRFHSIHVHHLYHQIPLASKLLLPDIPVIATIHSYHDILNARPHSRELKIVENYNRLLLHTDYVTHVSKSVREQAHSLHITWPCDDSIVYNGIDFSLRNVEYCDTIERQPNQVCFLGSLIESKGVWVLLEAIQAMRPEVENMVLAGRGKLKKEIHRYIRKHKLDNVQMVGYLPRDRAFELMSVSSVLVIPSSSESFGLAYIESVFAGTPVIGYDRVIEEFRQLLDLSEREAEWLIPFNHESEDAQELSQKIRQSLTIKNRETYCQERESLRTKIIADLSWGNIANEYWKTYRSMCGPE